MHLNLPSVSIVCLAGLLTACAQTPKNVVFVTKSSIGVDVEATTQSASLAYDRTEGYFAPRYVNQAPPTVYANMATNGKMIDRSIKQTYATGLAAELLSKPIAGAQALAPLTRPALLRSTALATPGAIVATPALPAPAPAGAAASGVEPKALLFGTGTVFGFKVGVGPTAIDSFTLGFKRKELSIIPQDEADGLFPSVLASIDTNASASPTLSASDGTITQFFATGVAADNLAVNERIHEKFETSALSAISSYREDERQQRRLALGSLGCLARLDDEQAKRVWKNVSDLGLFDKSAVDQLLAAAPAQARTIYTDEIGRTNADSKNQTGLMIGHQAYVCDLRNKT